MNDNVIPLRRVQQEQPAESAEPPSVVTSSDRLLIMLNATQERGMTWRDVAAVTETSHGSASGLLSRLHKRGAIRRLSDEREGCKVYVTPNWVLGRTTEAPTRSSDNRLLDDMAALLRAVPTRCKHIEWRPNCRSCEVRSLLIRYDGR